MVGLYDGDKNIKHRGDRAIKVVDILEFFTGFGSANRYSFIKVIIFLSKSQGFEA